MAVSGLRSRVAVWAMASLALSACRFGDYEEDAGPIDGAVIDAEPLPPDAPPADAARFDAGPPDADVPDATPPDAGPTFDAGPHPMNPLEDGLSTLVGDSVPGFVNGPRDFALLDNPVNVVVGPDGDIFVADFNNDAIRRISPTGETTTVVKQPDFQRPFGMTFTPAGDFYVQTDRNTAGSFTGALWKVSLETGVVTLVFNGVGRMRGLGSLSDGRLIFGDASNHTIHIYNPIGDTVTFVAGETGVPSFSDGIATQAHFDTIRDLVVTDDDVIFVADADNQRVRRVTLAGVVTTIAGNGVSASVDGPALTSSLATPSGLALDDAGDLYISEFSSGLIRKLSGGALTTVAGSTRGYADDLDPLQGQLFANEGIDFAAPFLYISDGNNGENDPSHRVRRMTVD